MKTILQCEDSTDGIFTAIYEAWASKRKKDELEIQAEQTCNFELFSEYIEVQTDSVKAEKVTDTLRKRFGTDRALSLYYAALSSGEDKANAIFQTIRKGLSLNYPGRVMDDLADPFVCRVFELARSVTNESHHYTGFVRFRELKNGVLFSELEPQNDILLLLAPHFADRLPLENFILLDRKREKFIIHPKNKAWILVNGEQWKEEYLSHLSEEEENFQIWWKGFCTSISIKERENLSLQRQNLPKHFRNHMVEFSDLT